jgi:Rrf2 family protein
MVRLSRKTDYALIALGYLAEHPGVVVSAREIARQCQLPLPLTMNVLKSLHQRGLLRSIRGAAGGYRLSGDLSTVSLFDLTQMLDRVETGCASPMITGQPAGKLAIHGPAQALQYRLGRFMREVSLADLVMPGRRIDVPLERVRVLEKLKLPQQRENNDVVQLA